VSDAGGRIIVRLVCLFTANAFSMALTEFAFRHGADDLFFDCAAFEYNQFGNARMPSAMQWPDDRRHSVCHLELALILAGNLSTIAR